MSAEAALDMSRITSISAGELPGAISMPHTLQNFTAPAFSVPHEGHTLFLRGAFIMAIIASASRSKAMRSPFEKI
jgi:hypothetical protein